MKLGGITEFRYVPEWNGNRDLPDNEKLSLTVLPLRAADVLSDDDDADVVRWRDMQDVPDDLVGPLASLPLYNLRLLRTAAAHTTDLQGFDFGDAGQVTSPLEAFLRLSYGENDLLLEILRTINQTAKLTEDELKNFVALSAGTNSPPPTSAGGASEGADQNNVATKPDPTESSS